MGTGPYKGRKRVPSTSCVTLYVIDGKGELQVIAIQEGHKQCEKNSCKSALVVLLICRVIMLFFLENMLIVISFCILCMDVQWVGRRVRFFIPLKCKRLVLIAPHRPDD